MNLGCGEIKFCASASDLLMHSNNCIVVFNVNLVRVVTHEKHWCRFVGV
jgi:hypothetical protein